VGRLPVHSVTQGTILSSVHINIQEVKLPIRLGLHGELDIG